MGEFKGWVQWGGGPLGESKGRVQWRGPTGWVQRKGTVGGGGPSGESKGKVRGGGPLKVSP